MGSYRGSYEEATASYETTMGNLWDAMGVAMGSYATGGYGRLWEAMRRVAMGSNYVRAMGSYGEVMGSYAEAMAKLWEVMG